MNTTRTTFGTNPSLRRYAEPFTKIQYVLDWTRGAEVDLGCGTMAVGDSTRDPLISKGGAFLYPGGPSVSGPKHPNSMHRISYQWLNGQRNLQANDPGFYSQRCPRSVAMVNQFRNGQVSLIKRLH